MTLASRVERSSSCSSEASVRPSSIAVITSTSRRRSCSVTACGIWTSMYSNAGIKVALRRADEGAIASARLHDMHCPHRQAPHEFRCQFLIDDRSSTPSPRVLRQALDRGAVDTSHPVTSHMQGSPLRFGQRARAALGPTSPVDLQTFRYEGKRVRGPWGLFDSRVGKRHYILAPVQAWGERILLNKDQESIPDYFHAAASSPSSRKVRHLALPPALTNSSSGVAIGV